MCKAGLRSCRKPYRPRRVRQFGGLTFAAFPVVGLSLTGPNYSLTELWETARYTLQPRLLRIPGVARTGIVGGRAPEYHVIVDPLRLQAVNLSLSQVSDALVRNNLIAPTGMLEEDYKLYLTVVDGRVHTIEDIENLTVSVSGNTPSTWRHTTDCDERPSHPYQGFCAS